MQTFLPHADFALSVAALDNKRLGKQRVEAWQIYRTLTGVTKGWANHPAVRMWCGHEAGLAYYMHCAIEEWVKRGFKNTMRAPDHSQIDRPVWLGDEAFHLSHRSNLVRKLPEHYGRLWPDVSPDLPYVWPKAKDTP